MYSMEEREKSYEAKTYLHVINFIEGAGNHV